MKEEKRADGATQNKGAKSCHLGGGQSFSPVFFDNVHKMHICLFTDILEPQWEEG